MLSIRQKNILKFIIIEYTNTVLPVGSEFISQNAKLNVSPATIRKDLIEFTFAVQNAVGYCFSDTKN